MKKKKSHYLPRETSWIEFNDRVLDRAFMDSVPLLERVKFLAITSSNLDEFMMVRFGGLTVVQRSITDIADISGLDATEQIKMIRERVRAMQQRQIECFDELLPLLADAGIRRLERSELSDIQRDFLFSHYESEIVTSIAPVGIDESQPLPLFSGLRLHLCVRIKDNEETRLVNKSQGSKEGDDESGDRFLIVPLPRNLPRVWAIPTTEHYSFMLLEDIVGLFLDELLPGQEILDWTTFRITRNGDVVLVDDDARSDLLQGMEEVLEARKLADCVRLEISSAASDATSKFLQLSLIHI